MPVKNRTSKNKKKTIGKTKKKIQKEKNMKYELELSNLPPPGPLEKIRNMNKNKKPSDKFKNVEEPMNWGLGVEHEMHIFHKGKGGMKNTNIVFDSQESSCFLTGEKDPKG